MDIRLELNGQPIEPSSLADALEQQMFEIVASTLREKLSGIRDPDTGEAPVVVLRGDSIDDLSCHVDGSPELLAIVRERMGLEDGDVEEGDVEEEDAEATEPEDAPPRPPRVFLSHAHADAAHSLALATALNDAGIHVVYDKWDVQPGDSLVGFMEDGLAEMTHFLLLATPASIGRPWVTAEWRAALHRRLGEGIKLIVVRKDLGAQDLPVLLRDYHSPSLDGDFGETAKALIDAIHGVGRRPPLGPRPPVAAAAEEQARLTGGSKTGLTPAAEAIARLLLERSQLGCEDDDVVPTPVLREGTGLSDEAIEDAVDELEGQGLVSVPSLMGHGDPLGYPFIRPKNALFTEIEPKLRGTDPPGDALRIAVDLMNAEDQSDWLRKLAETYGWSPRRMNPAVAWLLERDLIETGNEIGSHPWITHWIRATPKTRRFVRDRGRGP